MSQNYLFNSDRNQERAQSRHDNSSPSDDLEQCSNCGEFDELNDDHLCKDCVEEENKSKGKQ